MRLENTKRLGNLIKPLNSLEPSSPQGNMLNPDMPSGYRFHPTDEDLILCYLYPKAAGKPFKNWGVKECDLYGDKNPSEIWDEFGGRSLEAKETDLYFFTKVKRTAPHFSRLRRLAGLGSWVVEDVAKRIKGVFNGKLQVLGFKKRFRFDNSKTDDDGCWIMHEYTLHPALLSKIPNPPSDDYVLARFRMNKPTGAVDLEPRLRKRKIVQLFGKSIHVDGEELNPDEVNFFDELNDIVDNEVKVSSHPFDADELLSQLWVPTPVCPLDLQFWEQDKIC